jgi:predicted RNase H-like HicB family nuclease
LEIEKKRFVYYQEDDMWIGWLEEFPDYRTQGETLEELEETLKTSMRNCRAARFLVSTM